MNSLPAINSPIIETENYPEILTGFSNLQTANDVSNNLSTRLLHNPFRLQEIYDLRLEVWEKSGVNEFVNRKLFPNGWYDELDDTAMHWVTVNHQNKIVASARLNIFYSLQESPYGASIKHLKLPAEVPFAFFSRLVVHPSCRQNGLSRELYEARAHFCKERKIAWSQVFINNPYVISMFEAKGFKNIGEAEVSYHVSSPSHTVNVFVKETIYE